MQKIPKKVGEILVERNLVTEQQLLAALDIQRNKKLPLGEILVEQGFIKQETLDAALARQYGSHLGEILINAKMINFEKLLHAFDVQRTNARPLGDILIELQYIKETDLLQALAKQYHLKIVNLSGYEINPDAFSKISMDILKRYNVMPINFDGDSLVVATADPEDILAISDLEFISGHHIKLVLAAKKEIRSYLE